MSHFVTLGFLIYLLGTTIGIILQAIGLRKIRNQSNKGIKK